MCKMTSNIIYLEPPPKKLIKNSIPILREFSKVAGYKLIKNHSLNKKKTLKWSNGKKNIHISNKTDKIPRNKFNKKPCMSKTVKKDE